MNVKWRLARLTTTSVREVGFRVARSLQAQAESIGLTRAQAPHPKGVCGRAWVDPLPRAFDARPYTRDADRSLAAASAGNGHVELLRLAQAWHLSGEARYLEACRAHLDAGFAQVPYLAGDKPKASLEHAVPLVHWAFVWHLLGGDASPLFAGEQGASFRLRWLNRIYQHCHFIERHLSRHSSANHHLIGELAGLFVGAVTWPLWPLAKDWQVTARRQLERETGAQNFADGVNREQALWYHQAVAEMLLVAGLVARANNADFTEAYWQRLEAMLEFVASIMDASGNVPAFGDADDSVLLRLDPVQAGDPYRPLLATGAIVFRRAEFKYKSEQLDPKTHWLLGDSSLAKFTQLDGTGSLPIRRAFPHAGYYVLGRDFETSREVRIVADAGPLGYLSSAAQGHADALSFTLSAGGSPILVDPGAYTHNAGRWRDYFRGTSAHNTVRIDGCDQSTSGGAFLWLKHAQARVEQFGATEMQEHLVAYHDGYERLADPVRHRRTWSFDRRYSALAVIDELDCKEQHEAEWFWHFGPGCEVSVRDNVLTAQCEHAMLTLQFAESLRCKLVAGGARVPLGWYSRAMGSKVPTVTAVIATTLRGTSRFRFDFQIVLDAPPG